MKRKYSAYIFTCVIMTWLMIFCACKKDVPVETEPNNTFSTANKISAGNPIEGYIQEVEDRDFYVLKLHENVHLDIQLSPVRGVNHAIRVWKDTINGPVMIKYIDDLRKSSPERMRGICAGPGILYLEICHGNRDVPRAEKEIPYRLLVIAEHLVDYECEPNDSRLAANPVSAGIGMEGFYSPSFNKLNEDTQHQSREEDWFTFSIDSTVSLPLLCDAEVTGVPGINCVLALFDGQGNELGMADSSPNNEGEMIRGAGLQEPGTYYIMVASADYQSNNEVPYMLSVNTREYDAGLEMEPNNTRANATLMMRQSISGTIFPDGDIDYYIYKSGTMADYFRISVAPPDAMDVSFTVEDERGKELFEVDNGSSGEKEIYPNAWCEGDIYVKVTGKRGQYSNDLPYSLAVFRVNIANLQDREPNDDKESAVTVQGDAISGFLSYRGDRDYYLLKYPVRSRKEFRISGIEGGSFTVSVTDPLGYIIKTVEVSGKTEHVFSEMVDKSGYIIVESVIENYDNPYLIQISEAR